MREYTFDMVLNAAVTVQAKDGATALKMLQSAMDCADCNGGAWPNGDPILFEASLSQRPSIGMIDGESVWVKTANEFADLAASEKE